MTRKPNIILFLTDDHGAWALGSYGNREVRSPVLDELATRGTRFNDAVTPSPVCSPARACVMTGRTPSQVGIHDWLQEAEPEIANRNWLADEITLPQLLSQGGYHCGLSGKWHLGRSHEAPPGFDWCFGFPGHQGAHIETYSYHLNGQPVTLSGNKTKIVTDHAITFLQQCPTDRPFFLNVGYIATHSPYGGQEPDLVASYRDATFVDVPPYHPHPWRKNEGFANDLEFDIQRRHDACANYYAAVTDIDRNVGRILQAIGATGRADDTVIVYVSDHGLTLGHHGFWGKGNSTRPLNMYETSLRVPTIWHGSGVAAGQTIDAPIDHYDTFMTLCEIAGVNVDKARNYPGRTYSAALSGAQKSMVDWPETHFGEYGDLRMIRTRSWKLVVRYPDGPHDLFDRIADPDEQENLADSPDHLAIGRQLRQQLDAFYACHSDPGKSGLRVKQLPKHNRNSEAWRDGLREARGLQTY